ncbi:phage virion morphogenesis protein [Pseudomonas nitroreducens]|uniref:phage virion morphogenesis protein n=1 Tax=Pseudomonas nitroreducens TaxID=46680 RepID=UPI002D7F5926|nr:phage virion morphogenesis protein [Pseudomonas nitroreducens]
MASPTVDFDVRGMVEAQERIALLELPPAKRRRLLNNTAKRLRTRNRKRLGVQQNLDGSPFTARKDGSKRKMLRGLSRTLQVVRLSDTEAVLGWKNRLMGSIAAAHQEGRPEQMSAARMRRLGHTPDYDAPASRFQARALLKAGYRIRRGKGWKRPPLAWITANLSAGRAGLILSKLTGEAKKQRWQIELPARAVLGADAQDVRDIVRTVLSQTINAPR